MTHGPSDQPNPTASRWELGGRLRQYRLDQDLTLEAVANELLVSPSKLSRLESGQRNATARDLRDLGALYRLTPAQLADLKSLAEDARTKPWYAYLAGRSQHAVALFDLELVASRSQEYQGMFLPGLLQVPRYTQALLQAVYPEPLTDAEERSKAAEARQRRQAAALPEGHSTRRHFVIDESALARAVGDDRVMAEQSARLLEVSEQSNVTIQVVPFTAGAHPGLAGGFTLLRFDEQPIRDAVYLEALHADWFLDRPGEVETYVTAFDHLRDIALDPDATRSLLLARERTWRGNE